MTSFFSAHLHLRDETSIDSHQLNSSTGRYVQVLTIGDGATDGLTLFVNSREQAEKLFDAITELTMAWREEAPDAITVDAQLAPGDLSTIAERNVLAAAEAYVQAIEPDGGKADLALAAAVEALWEERAEDA